MDKLRHKVFYTIFLILSFCLLILITSYNVLKYIENVNSINNNLNVSLSRKKEDDGIFPPNKDGLGNELEKDDNKDLEDVKFIDSVIYTVLIDEDNNIKEVINHSNADIDDKKIMSIAKKILNSNIKSKYLGCLYFNRYAYLYNASDSLVIIDNKNVNKNLINTLIVSLIIYFLLSLIIFFITRVITNWIIKPVSVSFSKQKKFIEDASHELKTPLSVIMASTDMLSFDDNNKKWINNIKNEADRMNLLVTNLLELSTVEKSDLLNLKFGDLSKVINLAVLTFEGKAYESGVFLESDISDGIMMMFDENRIRQLVEILLDNAIKHAFQKTKVKLLLKEDKNCIVLEVTNVGDVIPKGEEVKIFERFYRVDKSRNRNNNSYGLGLAIAKNIVNSHNGEISASSNCDVTTFKVLFKK